MGKVSKAKKKAKRKENRAVKKEKRADRKQDRAKKAEEKGKTNKANRLNNRANQLNNRAAELKAKAKDINSQIEAQVIRGMYAEVIAKNEVGSTTIQVVWNYFSDELSQFETLRVTIEASSPFRAQNWNDEKEVATSVHICSFGPMKNLRYTVSLYGIYGAVLKQLDRVIVNKL